MYQVKMLYGRSIPDIEKKMNFFLLEHPNIIIEKIIQNDADAWTTLTILYKTNKVTK